MSLPDYPMSVARDRFGLWLHVTGLSLRDVVAALPHCFEAEAFLVYDDQQFDYATSSLVDHRRREGAARADAAAEMARLNGGAFWNRREPLFECDTAVVWPADCLNEMIAVQGDHGGCLGLTPVSRDAAERLPDDFVYEHPSNVEARFTFLSTDDRATSVFVADEADLLTLVRHVLAKALELRYADAPGLDDAAAGLRARLEEGGVDVRARRDEDGDSAPQAATVAVGPWMLRSQWPLLWRSVSLCDLAWDGQRWALSGVRHEPGRRYVSGFRLLGELFHWSGYLTRYAVVIGLPLAAAAVAWAMTGPLGGLLALIAAALLWPRFVLGTDWHQLRRRRADEDELRGKYE